MRHLVTGACGFIGSHLCEYLLESGDEVVGVDCFTPYYPRSLKDDNLRLVRDHPRLQFVERDLSRGPLEDLLDGVGVVFHLSAQPGVRPSFGEAFSDYLRHNVHVTQRLLEVARTLNLAKFVYASSSSVYGGADGRPSTEEDERRPCSPYGLTKVATEDVAATYHRATGVPVVGLRYFTVYGARQRPDMAFSGFLNRALAGEPADLYGDGSQMRDFTHVSDAVRGTVAAARHGRSGAVYNIGGGTPVVLRDAIALLGRELGQPLAVTRHESARGDVHRTCADGRRAQADLGFAPVVPLEQGIVDQVRWRLDLQARLEHEAVLQPACRTRRFARTGRWARATVSRAR